MSENEEGSTNNSRRKFLQKLGFVSVGSVLAGAAIYSGYEYQNKIDGEIFYNINEGKAIMPKFKTTLPEKDRWKLVSYIRSFNTKYIQPAIVKSENLLTKTVRIDFKYDSLAYRISLMAYSVINKDTTRLKGSDELIFVKRYFGSLQIGQAVKINDKGIATFDFPKTLPGDKNGTVELEARINDDKYGEIIISKRLKIGVPTYKPPLNEKRAIWNIQSKAPIWLLFTTSQSLPESG